MHSTLQGPMWASAPTDISEIMFGPTEPSASTNIYKQGGESRPPYRVRHKKQEPAIGRLLLYSGYCPLAIHWNVQMSVSRTTA